MPSRAARWISQIAWRSNVADSRSEGRGPGIQPISVCPRVVAVEVVEAARRAVAPEAVEAADAGAIEQLAQLGLVLGAQLLLDAVGAEPRDLAADVDARLVQRVAEAIAGVAAHHQPALLRHERAHVTDRPADDDVDALHRDPAAARRVAPDHEQAAAAA